MGKSLTKLRWLLVILALALIIGPMPTQRLSAGILPPLDLKRLAGKADAIMVGQVVSIRDEGPALAKTVSGDRPARAMTATLQVDAVLKGLSPGRTVEVRFMRPEEMIGYWPISAGEYGTFFLTSTPPGFAVLDPYHPYVAAAQGATASGKTPFERVIAELAAALESPTASRNVRMMARSVLDQTPGPEATGALLRGALSTSKDVRYHCIAALLRRDNIEYLRDAGDILIHPPEGTEPDWVEDVALGLSGVRDPRAIPLLADILAGSPLVNARRSAAGDLRGMRDPKAIKPLALGLYDADAEVQYFAVIGLAVLTGAPTEWSPANGTFLNDPRKYLAHWRGWARGQEYAPAQQKP
ncbi:MAG TPA: hypothetical protein VFL79_03955 [Terriglobia bacterium]|nr:hypothetical protein [Terriglobia bacterium]